MSQSSKAAYYQAIKAAGVPLDRHYRDFTTDELKALAAENGVAVEVAEPRTAPTRPDEMTEIKEQISGLSDVVGKLAALVVAQAAPAPQPKQVEPPAQKEAGQLPRPAAAPRLDPNEHAGVTLNTHREDEPIRVDEHGNLWYQNEVNKPGYAKPRGRRVLRAMDSGTVQETISVAGGYTETFEVPGDPAHAKPIEIKVTLPSYQTGIFKAPGMPFKIHTYQGARGFDWDDVNRYYGGADLVPDTIKRVYVSSDLCYDMTTTIRAVNDEYRERVLKKETVR